MRREEEGRARKNGSGAEKRKVPSKDKTESHFPNQYRIYEAGRKKKEIQ